MIRFFNFMLVAYVITIHAGPKEAEKKTTNKSQKTNLIAWRRIYCLTKNTI